MAVFKHYMELIFPTPLIVSAFVDHYQYLNKNAIEFLETAHDEQEHLALIGRQLPLLRFFVTRDARRRRAVFAWATFNAKTIEQTLDQMITSIPELGNHITKQEDTELFLEFYVSD